VLRRRSLSVQLLDGHLILSATDLSNHLVCRHLTSLDLRVAHRLLEVPKFNDPFREALAARGLEHESRYLAALKAEGLHVENLKDFRGPAGVEATLAAMRKGLDVIAQGTLQQGRWGGRPDVLRRVEASSALGPWSYQVLDTKLAAETRAGTILQLALYSDLLYQAQGHLPERFHVVTPEGGLKTLSYRVLDYAAYFRLVRRGLEESTKRDPQDRSDTYPERVPACDACRWWSTCDARWHADDHLSLVANISRLHRRTLEGEGIRTLERLARLPLPLPFSPARGSKEPYERLREQARIQLDGRLQKAPVHELLQPFDAEHGLARLPEPSSGDIFLDFEGDPFVPPSGREFLVGLVQADDSVELRYHTRWARTDSEERGAFEWLIDRMLDTWARHPGMHVYHYAPYEPAAIKRLMGRHATRQEEVDRLLRAERFVDLYAVVKHSLRASVESYSIKKLEPFYDFERQLPLRDASAALHRVERALELGDFDAVDADLRGNVESYNQDDCRSALHLRDWLEELRTEVERTGFVLPRGKQKEEEPEREPTEGERRAEELRDALLAGLPPAREGRTAAQQGQWLLAHLLEWHRREEKAPWWEYFRLMGLTEEELLDEPHALARLEFVERVVNGKTPVDRYRFPVQEFDMRDGEALRLLDDGELGTVQEIDREARTVDVKKRKATAEIHPTAVFAFSFVGTEPLKEALQRIAASVLEHCIDGPGPFQAGRDLLQARPPRLEGETLKAQHGETDVGRARRFALVLDDSVLPIQGPPGAGKTYVGARMICELVRAGKRVGVTGPSHKVIRNLLDEVVKAAPEFRVDPGVILQKVSKKSDPEPPFREVTTNPAIEKALQEGAAVQVIGGTAWLWAREELTGAVDVLFIDEAGQLSLANALAVSQGAKSLVLLGDPRQLEQPQQGSHPEGADVSALEHLLQGHETMPPDKGLFLAETWRLAPKICEFTSELFYEGRLKPHPGLERQALKGTGPFTGSGLWVVPVEHEGNRSASDEEVAAIARVIDQLLAPDARWTDSKGDEHRLTADDVLVVAPYNAQVARLDDRLAARGIRVGTVDRFQGQEAPVVIYSMASSSPEDAPRGMDFLYSAHRLNVATSRARCACILVASPRLFQAESRTPEQIRLANAFCRYLELAETVRIGM
jgi:predicted RecB family nuclease